MRESDPAPEEGAPRAAAEEGELSGELSDELLDLVVGGIDPDLARARYEHFELALSTGQIPIEALRPLG